MAGRIARAASAAERAGGAALPLLSGARAAFLAALRAAVAREIALRRPFLWLPAAAGGGALLYFAADREPSFAVSAGAFAMFAALAVALRGHRAASALCLVLACVSGGFFSAVWRAARVDAPIVPRAGVGFLTGFVEELDPRRAGARFILRVASAEGLPGEVRPTRVRLTTRGEPKFAAGDFIALKARVLPPARAALPGGYDFARDAYFAGLGGVGNALGRIEVMPPPDPPPLSLRVFAAIDRLRNDLAARVYRDLGGDTGAIAAAMVTGKRDFLSEEAKELIRRAGIFHIITISGVQMTLVAGIFFVGFRRLLALSRTLALNYPIKKWAAALAILGAVSYDLATGSRVGTERALVMTTVMLIAVLFDRPSLSMRNLAFAVVFVVAFEPEALLGASFQLSFAAVAALVAVYEARGAMIARRREPLVSAAARPGRAEQWRESVAELLLHGPGAPLFATLCATSATASFMAGNFHELSPYVLIGNPLTLAIIEFFAVPAALLGAMLYPFGLDGPVWLYLGFGIDLVTRIAGLIAAAPGASLPVRSFAPFAIVFLALAVLSAVIWRSWILRATAIPFAVIGLYGAANGEGFDMAVAPTGEAAAVRRPSGELALLGRGKLSFIGEQWLRADADPRAPADARDVACDELGCVTKTVDGRKVALVSDRRALIEDCARAEIVIAPFDAPAGCGAPILLDRRKLRETGAVTLRFEPDRIVWRMARGPSEDRPWSRAPQRRAERETAEPVAEEDMRVD